MTDPRLREIQIMGDGSKAERPGPLTLWRVTCGNRENSDGAGFARRQNRFISTTLAEARRRQQMLQAPT